MGYTLIIDNYDSFTWNVYADVAVLGGNPLVRRNNKISIEDVEAMHAKGDLDRIIISPGPGHPRTDSGISREVITWACGKVPVLGICMGLECLVDVLGGEIAFAGEIKHGKTSLVEHDGLGIFHELPALLQSTRYHSLAATLLTLPKELAVTATTQESGVIMAVRHREYAVEAVQYHPESCMSEGGRGMMANFLRMKGGYWGENEWCGAGKAQPEAKANGSAHLPTILDRIHAQRLVDVDAAAAIPASTPANLHTSLSLHTAPAQIDLVKRITSTPHTAVMAEIKRASPSKGDISLHASAPEQALKYALAGASVISVLTEPKWFKGGLTDMLAVRQAIDSLPNRPAVLRKDFILSTYQIDEARLYGADTVLLIVAMLSPSQLQELYSYSLSLGMEPLVEVNNPQELQLALALGSKVIGVNNRNLHDFKVDMETTSRVNAALDGKDVILCALSGISSPEDVSKYVKEGVRAVLVGEALMRAEDAGKFLRELISLPPPSPTPSPRPIVKICGIRSTSDASIAIAAGADLLGVILVPGTKRCIPLSRAKEISTLVRSAASISTPIPAPSTPEGWFAFHARQLQSRRKPLLVGVFRDQPLEEILSAVDEGGLDMVQLHGDEPQAWARFIPVPVIKVFRVKPDGTVLGGEIGRPGLNQFVLLDTAGGGGEGKAFPWEHARKIIEAGEVGIKGSRMPVLLAGGLGPENVGEAVAASGGVLGVDVASGVEGAEGKDKEKVGAFVKAARG
ncbi:uncharacterized protein MKK02DRAFT_39347 [Dioszegia hungarica]|uniref:Multifunctional tryptophan biosynthesis protein n=1 Tax=Dioszegia hungarica TaxID=4972 RepID=A0AA38HGJ3_9TREE|nr:uncharacterized protein MKK02DRAFT_39347 [Dioszegia hungarica]KAI9639071.1 hypothetical protein MKK02DRAFT_39347 [Dioszegia hungarica]